jgi:hypothetical protein
MEQPTKWGAPLQMAATSVAAAAAWGDGAAKSGRACLS